MLAKTKLAKLEKDLNEIQKRARVRTLDIEQIEAVIEVAEAAVKSVPAEYRSMFTYEYQPHEVAASYDYAPEGTQLFLRFSKTGKAISAEVARGYFNDTHSRLVISLTELREHMAQLGIDNSNPRFQDIMKVFLRDAGVSAAHGTRQVREVWK